MRSNSGVVGKTVYSTWTHTMWVLIPTFPLSSWMILVKLCNISEFQFHYLYKVIIKQSKVVARNKSQCIIYIKPASIIGKLKGKCKILTFVINWNQYCLPISLVPLSLTFHHMCSVEPRLCLSLSSICVLSRAGKRNHTTINIVAIKRYGHQPPFGPQNCLLPCSLCFSRISLKSPPCSPNPFFRFCPFLLLALNK